MQILVIGGTGFIGTHAVRLLVEHGHDVAVLHRGRTASRLPASVHSIVGDRNALAELRAELVRLAPDVVLDVVPYTEAHARSLVEAMRGIAGRVVALSSGDVYRNYDGFRGQSTAPPDPTPLMEGAPLRTSRYPYRGYGLPQRWADDYDKLLVEEVVMRAPDLPGTILRLPAVYGPGDPQHRLRSYLQRMDDGRPAIVLGEAHAEWRWTRGYVENVAAAIARAVTDERTAGHIYNVGGAEVLTERAWVEQIATAAGWPGDVVAVPETALRDPFDYRYHLATNTRRLRDELGYTDSVSLPEALRRTIAWSRTQPTDGGIRASYAAEDAVLKAIGLR
ncbi:MAG: NAD-dependent epimerase/dehydratase family protein [Bacteroidota bacterium]